MTKFFITATDTDAGKTYIATLLVEYFVKLGKRTSVFKPVSAGCDLVDKSLVNEDALRLKNASNAGQSLSNINPIAFREPIAPHIAARRVNSKIDVCSIVDYYQEVLANPSDIVITEGAGGWRLPLGNGHYLSEFAQQTTQKVILVVNMKLGCLNHAILTYEAIVNDGVECVGWIANAQQDMDFLAENIEELCQLLPVPKLATVQKNQTALRDLCIS